MESIQEIASELGYPIKDNRSFDWKNINKAIQNGFKIQIAPKGKVYIKNDFRYNISISNNGKSMLFYRKSIKHDVNFFANAIVESIGRFCEVYPIDFDNSNNLEKCHKCNGKGKILSFMHYAKGVCFDCMGIGYLQKK